VCSQVLCGYSQYEVLNFGPLYWVHNAFSTSTICAYPSSDAQPYLLEQFRSEHVSKDFPEPCLVFFLSETKYDADGDVRSDVQQTMTDEEVSCTPDACAACAACIAKARSCCLSASVFRSQAFNFFLYLQHRTLYSPTIQCTPRSCCTLHLECKFKFKFKIKITFTFNVHSLRIANQTLSNLI
jgi:hypothetical protein